VLETIPVMVCLLTPDYHVAFANRVFKEKFGESKGRHCYDYCFGNNKPCSFCESFKVLETGEPHRWEVHSPDGSIIDAYDYPFTDADGKPMILEMDIDVTQQRITENELKEYRLHLENLVEERTAELHKSNIIAYERAEELEKLHERLEAKAAEVEEYATNMESLAESRAIQLRDAERLAAIGATAGMVGHDIRNPLQSILGDLFLVKTELIDLPNGGSKERILESLTEIEKSLDYVNKIVQDLQDFAKPIRPSLMKFDLAALCQETIYNQAIPNNIEASCSFHEDAKSIFTDPTLIKRVLVNLVNNAVQAMPDGGKLSVNANITNGYLYLTVSDTGMGIPEETQPKLFTPLMTTKSKGQGFGLAVVKRMTEALGGTVSFESKVAKGTTFTLKFPFTKPA